MTPSAYCRFASEQFTSANAHLMICSCFSRPQATQPRSSVSKKLSTYRVGHSHTLSDILGQLLYAAAPFVSGFVKVLPRWCSDSSQISFLPLGSSIQCTHSFSIQ